MYESQKLDCMMLLQIISKSNKSEKYLKHFYLKRTTLKKQIYPVRRPWLFFFFLWPILYFVRRDENTKAHQQGATKTAMFQHIRALDEGGVHGGPIGCKSNASPCNTVDWVGKIRWKLLPVAGQPAQQPHH